MEREEIKNLLEDAREEKCCGWELYAVGVYSYNGELEGYITWKGQGMDEIVYNRKYDDIVDLTDLCNVDEYDIDDAVDIAVDRIDYLEL